MDTLLTPGFLLLALLCVGLWLVGGPVMGRLKRAEQDLTSDELKTFRERFARGRNRAEMPTKFAELAEASDRASRIWLFGMVAVIVILVAIIALGPGLGLGLGAKG
jgi:hypothetical protein